MSQNNKIDNYLHPIFRKRLEDELKSGTEGSTTPTVLATTNDQQISTNGLAAVSVTGSVDDYEELKAKYLQLKKENEKLIKDNRVLKKLLNESRDMNLYKDMKMKRMKKDAEKEIEVPKVVSRENGSLFKSYESKFSSSQMKILRSMGSGQRNDSKFIKHCAEYIYDGIVEKLKTKYSGDRKVKGKVPITPEKKLLISSIFSQRIDAEELNDETSNKRLGRLNRLVGDAIYCLSKNSTNSTETQNIVGINNSQYQGDFVVSSQNDQIGQYQGNFVDFIQIGQYIELPLQFVQSFENNSQFNLL